MTWLRAFSIWGRCPQSPEIYRVIRQNSWSFWGTGYARPHAIPAAESALGSHLCVALSSAQVLPGWTTSTSPCNDFSANGDYPLNFVSHSRGSLQKRGFTRTSCCERAQNQAESLVGNARAMIKFTAWPFAAPCWISSNRHPRH